jgi:hypothetical protein
VAEHVARGRQPRDHCRPLRDGSASRSASRASCSAP